MPLITPLLAAMVIATAFWGGVLLARRLREWGEGRPMLDEGPRVPALPAAGAREGHRAVVRKVRARVAERLHAEFASGGMSNPVERAVDELTVDRIRADDVVTIESGHDLHDGDYLVEGYLRLDEGGATTIVAVLADGATRRWLVAPVGSERWFVIEPVSDHGLSDEPPRNIRHNNIAYSLEHRTQASSAATGRHGRPTGSRVGTYLFQGPGHDVLWLERWGRQVLMGHGVVIPRRDISFLPGS